LPEVRPAVAPTEAGASVPQMVGAHTCIKRNERRDPPLDTGTNAYYIQDAVPRSEPGLLDLVRLVLRTAGPRHQGRRTRVNFVEGLGAVAAAGPIEGLAELGVVYT